MKKLLITLALISAMCIIFLLAGREKETDIIEPSKENHQQVIKNKHENIRENQKVKIKSARKSKKIIKFQNCGPDTKCNKKNQKLKNEETNDLEILGSDTNFGV